MSEAAPITVRAICLPGGRHVLSCDCWPKVSLWVRRWLETLHRAAIRVTVRTVYRETGSVRDLERFRAAVGTWAAGDTNRPADVVMADALTGDGLATVVLVERISDLHAVEALAARQNRDLADEGICVLSIGGAMSAGRFLRLFGAPRFAANVRGLCDEAEENHFRRGLEQAGFGTGLTRSAMESLGFYVCVADLEDELIRALGPAAVERVLAAGEDLARFRVFQNQPAQRGRPVERQLRRFMGTTSGRKARYARALVLALEPNRIPRPLDRLLASV